MVWGCFSARGAPQLRFLSYNLDSLQYCDVLSNVMVPFAETAYQREWRFQQDNASTHVSQVTNEFFFDMIISVLDWPACSPDSNPLEDLWGILVRAVYKDFRQFDNLEDLREAIETARDNLDKDLLKNLVNSIPRRCIQVIKRGGGSTKC